MAPVDRDIDLCHFPAMASTPSAVESGREAPSQTERATEAPAPLYPELVGVAPPSPAGPIDAAEASTLATPPDIPPPTLSQTMRFSIRQIEFVFRYRRELGET